MRARYITTGLLAISPQAFGVEYEIAGSAPKDKPFEELGQVAVIRITGPLGQHPSWMWQDYETIYEQAKAAFGSASRAVALCINSPGGSAAGCFELARALRKLAVESGKPLGVYVDGIAASAAYAIACSATAGIHALQTSTVASLAVFEALVDQTSMDKAIGVQFTFVPSTGADLKLTGNPHTKPTEAQIAHTQGQVDLLTDYFYALVEEMRSVPQSEIRALRGAALLAAQGVDRGLVDSLKTWPEFAAFLETCSANGKDFMNPQASAQAKAKTEEKAPFDECLATLVSLSQGDDGDMAKKAKRAIAAIMKDEEPEGGEEKKDEPDAKRAEGGGEEKKPEGAAAAAGAQAAAASPSNELSLAKQVQELLAKDARRDEEAKRSTLLASRPDFSAHIVKSLTTAPLALVEQACKDWPRVTSTSGAAAAAATPGVTPGVTDNTQPGIRPEQHALLARMGTSGPQAASARIEGTSLVLENLSPAAAAKRLAEMQAQGLVPNGVPHDMARLTNTEFKVAAK